jgi:hypothetical protein
MDENDRNHGQKTCKCTVQNSWFNPQTRELFETVQFIIYLQFLWTINCINIQYLVFYYGAKFYQFLYNRFKSIRYERTEEICGQKEEKYLDRSDYPYTKKSLIICTIHIKIKGQFNQEG